jgi:ATP-binding cassette subfamily B protein
MLLVSLLGGLCTIAASFLASRTATKFAAQIREMVFTKIESFSLFEFNKFSTASLITRSTNDIQQVQTVLVMILRMFVSAPIMGVGAIIKAYNSAPSMSWIIVVSVIVLIGIMGVLFVVAIPKFKLLQKLVDKLNLVAREMLTGLRVIRAFNNEKYSEDKFDKTNRELTKMNLFVNRLMVFMQPLMMLVMNFAMLAVIWVGAHLIGTKDLLIGDMMAFMQYAMQVIMSFLMLSIMFIMVPRASVSAKRITEVLETEPKIKDPEKEILIKVNDEKRHNLIKFGAGPNIGKQGLIEFKNVGFKYPHAEEHVLNKINFTALPGEVTAIVGGTGSGKSTLINLIPRFFDVSEGNILVDGVDVKDMMQHDLRKKIGFVPQKGMLFSGTIISNVRYGKIAANLEEVKRACEIAQAKEFIEKMPDKYYTDISQGGLNLSGGQKQRLAIARAILKRPEIYIFDDSFSALDFKTDLALRKALFKELAGATVLIVAQRISTIMKADKIIVLENGEIVGMGVHEELIETCPVYKEIAFSQLTKSELSGQEKEANNE